MSFLVRVRILKAGNDRLFEPLCKAVTIMDGLGIAVLAVQSGGNFTFSGGFATAFCSSFPTVVKFPMMTPMQAVVAEKPLTELRFVVEPMPASMPVHLPNRKQHKVTGHAHTVLYAICLVYVDLFEKHRRWLRTTFGSDTQRWPPFFNFVRMLRNFISHHEGCVAFDNPNAAPVTWHHLSYSPKDIGKRVIGDDIQLGDMLLLFFEIGDELDRLNCPHNP